MVVGARRVNLDGHVITHIRRHWFLAGVRFPLDGIVEMRHGRQCAGNCGGHIAGIALGRCHGMIGLSGAVGCSHDLIRGGGS